MVKIKGELKFDRLPQIQENNLKVYLNDIETFVDIHNRFTFAGVPDGTYFLNVYSLNYKFPETIVNISNDSIKVLQKKESGMVRVPYPIAL